MVGLFEIQSKIEQWRSWHSQASIRNPFNCVHNCDNHSLLNMFSVSHYYKLKGFERDYISILRLSQKKNKKNNGDPTILTMFSPKR